MKWGVGESYRRQALVHNKKEYINAKLAALWRNESHHAVSVQYRAPNNIFKNVVRGNSCLESEGPDEINSKFPSFSRIPFTTQVTSTAKVQKRKRTPSNGQHYTTNNTKVIAGIVVTLRNKREQRNQRSKHTSRDQNVSFYI